MSAIRTMSGGYGVKSASRARRSGGRGARGSVFGRLGRLLAGVVALSCVAGVVVWCAPAYALIDRGHVLGFAFDGVGEAAFSEPSGVAVDEATGDVYVVDRGHERVEQFRPQGDGAYVFVAALKVDSPGAIAVDNAPGSPSTGDVYVAGTQEPGGEAVERNYMYKFTAAGEKLFKRDVFKAKREGEPVELELEDIQGLAVDGNGTVWAYWGEEGQIDGFSDAESNKWLPSAMPAEFEGAESRIEECSARPDFAVAPRDESFYVGYERENSGQECPGEAGEKPDAVVVGDLTGTGTTLTSREVDRENTTGVAVESRTGDVYLDNGLSVAAFTPSGLLIQRFGAGELHGASGVAVDGKTGEVFVADPTENEVTVFVPEEAGPPVVDDVSSENLTPSSVELRAQIDPHGGETEYYFQYGTSDCQENPSSCAEVPVPPGKIASGFGDQSVSVEVSGLAPASAYYYRVLASNALSPTPVQGVPSPNTFTTLPSPGALPDGRAWEIVSPPDKHGGAIEALPREGGAMIMAGADGDALTWVANGPIVSEPLGSRSPELAQLLSTRAAGGWQTQSLETPHNHGSGIEKTEPFAVEYQDFSPDLSLALLEPPDPQPAGEPPLGVLETPPLSPEGSQKTIYVRDDPPIEPNQAEQTIYQQAGSEGNRDYLAPGYLPLITAANDTAGSVFGGGLDFLGASPDLSHIVFGSKVALSSSAPSAAGLYEWTPGAPLALVSVLPDAAASNDAFLGDGEGQGSGAPGLNARDAVSSDGSRVFWSEGKEHLYLRDTQSGETIEVNAAQGHDATEPGQGGQEVPEPGAGEQEVHFQDASSDGLKVFFTDTARLGENSTLEPIGEEGPSDLYEFEITSATGQPLRGRLSDLTPVSAEGAADVLNLLPGTSEDGSIVYFVANGVLAPGGTPGHCTRYYEEETTPPPAATCNLYVSEPDPQAPGERETKFIAVLSNEDGADWGAGPTSALIPEQDLSTVSSKGSPHGRYLAFMSERSLTGYDNEDRTSKAPGERLDEEVFLYDAVSDRLICASCNPSGARPQGVFDTQLGGEGLGLLVDRSENWRGHWLAGSLPAWTLDYGKEKSAIYQSRYLSDSGRLFFDAADPLVPQVSDRTREEPIEGNKQQVGVENVYEYEPQNVGSCGYSGGCVGLISSGASSEESAFLDASENGNDAFFLTAAALVPQDDDSAFDIYDARVCSQGSPCLSSPASSSTGCESTSTCRGQTPSPPVQQPAAASATYSGPGNTLTHSVLGTKTTGKPKPLTHAQKLTNALKVCRRIKKKHRRAVCEAQARKRYGAKPKAREKARKSISPNSRRSGR